MAEIKWNDGTVETLGQDAKSIKWDDGTTESLMDVSSMSGPEKFLTGVGKGMTDIATGTAQRVLEGGEFIRNILGLESNQENIDKLKKIVEENRTAFKPLSDQSAAANIGEFLGQVAPTVIIPGGVSGGALKRGGTSILSGAATGAIQPTGEDESAAANATIGGLAGGVASGATSSVGKLINAISDRLPPNVTESLAKKFGIRTTLGEATGNPITQKMETWLESVPVIGLKGFREAQQKDSEQASKNFLSKYFINPSSPDVMQSNRAFSGSLFEKLKNTIGGIQEQTIAPTNTRQAASTLLERYPDIFKKFQDTKRENIISSILNDTKPVKSVSPILDQTGKEITTITPKTLTFDEAWTLRDGLGEMIGQARKKLTSGDVDKTTLSEISRLYGAVNKDIEGWADSIGRPDVKTLIKNANDSYKQYVVKADIIKRAYDKASGEVGAGEMFSPKKLSTALKEIVYRDKELKRFGAAELDEMTGLANILQVVKRAGQFKENPPTGNRWGFPTLVGMSVLGSPAAAATEVGIVGVARFLTGTEAGKKLALTASKIEPDSRAMKALVNFIYNQIPKAAATGATREF